MLVTRWQAPVLPTKEQIKMIFSGEGLLATEEIYPPNSQVREHKHPFDEVRMIVSGQIIFNVMGNRLLLRAGDRIVIPANTRHATEVDEVEPCLSIVAQRVF